MTETSTIKYDRDHPYEMQMVWDEWLRFLETDDWPDTQINKIYDNWLAGKVRLVVSQKVWTRIVATYL